MKKINQVTLNIIMNLVSFAVAFAINFYVTPYVTKNVGMEAYGFIGLANNFTNYITIVTSALNSMASRFIIIQIHRGNSEEANKFFNSALFANTGFAMISMVFSAVFILNINHLLVVPAALVDDVKMTFFLVFCSFSISLVFSVFSVSYYAQNALSVGAMKTIESNVIRVIVIYLIFKFFNVKIQYTVLATIISGIYCNVCSVVFTKKNDPELVVSFKYFQRDYFLQMVKSGIWNSISKLSQVLLNGLDLIITNLYIAGPMLGNVSVAKSFASIIISIIGSVSDAFLPSFLKSFSDNPDSLEKPFLQSTKPMGYFSIIVLSVFIAYCQEFYMLWLPGEDAVLLRNLTCLSLLSVAVSGPLYAMFSIYTVINKVKPQALSSLIMAVLSTITVFILLYFTNLGVYAIVGVSTIYGIVKNLTYNMYCLKKYAKISIMRCYITVFKHLLFLFGASALLMYIKQYFVISSYKILFFEGIFGLCLISILYFLLMLDRDSREKITAKIKGMIHRGA